jgi:hypothetical protein
MHTQNYNTNTAILRGLLLNSPFRSVFSDLDPLFSIPDDDDDDYLRLQQGKRFHNLVYMSYVKHINQAKDISNERKNYRHFLYLNGGQPCVPPRKEGYSLLHCSETII